MLISHMFEDDETNFFVLSAGTQVLKGLNYGTVSSLTHVGSLPSAV